LSFSEFLHDWWDSRDIKKMRRKRRLRAQRYLKKMEIEKTKKDINEEESDKNTDENKLQPVQKKKIQLKGAFFAGKFIKNYKWGIWGILGIALVIVFLIFVLLGSNIFSVSEIEYKFEESVFINEEVLGKLIDGTRGENIFLLQTSDLVQKLKDTFLTISKVKIKKAYPSTLIFEIGEYKPALILRKGELKQEEYLVNQAGFVITKRPYTGLEAEHITVLKTNLDDEIKIGEQVMSSYLVDFIYRAESSFEDKVGIRVVSIWWLEDENELHMWTQKYFKVLMSFSRPVEDQISDMITALEDSRISRRNFEYVDLRVPNKVFVKPR